MVKESRVKNLPPTLYPIWPYFPPILLILYVPTFLSSLSVTPLSLSPNNILQQLLSPTLIFYSNFANCALHFPLLHPLSPPLHCHPIPHYLPLPQPLTHIPFTLLYTPTSPFTLQSSNLNPTFLTSNAHPFHYLNLCILLLPSGPQYFFYLFFSLSFASFYTIYSECSPFHVVCFNHFLTYLFVI